MYLLTDRREVLYGGAAGGGKSGGLLAAALQYADVPGYSALIIRKTYPQLSQSGGLIDLAQEWLADTDASWSGADHRWTFPSGAVLKFGHLQYANDRHNYQGGRYHFIGFDELTHWATDVEYRYMMSRARRPSDLGATHLRAAADGMTSAHVPIRMRSTTNPGGRGHEWVFSRFIVEWRAWREQIAAGNVTAPPPARPFIPSRVWDNPFLDVAEYIETLMELPPVEREQLLHGDWDVRPTGGMFNRSDFPVIRAPAMQGHMVRYWDIAATEPHEANPDPDWTVGALMELRSDATFIIHHVERFRKNPDVVEARIKSTAERDGKRVKIRMEQEGGASGKLTVDHYRRHVLLGYDFDGHPESKDKETRASLWAGNARRGEISVVQAEWNGDFFEEVDDFLVIPTHDDQIDAISGAYEVLTSLGLPAKKKAEVIV